MKHLNVQMLGNFSFSEGENLISDLQNRTKKVWLLLAFILCKRGQIVSRKELIQLLWGEDATSNNPENALKITFHRVRSLLDQLEPNAGHQLVIWQNNGYTWNMNIPMTLDIEEFEKECCAESANEADQLQAMKDNGMQVVENPDLDSFKTAVQVVYDAYPQYADYLAKINAVLAE